MVVISYRRFGTTYPSHFQGKQFSTLEDGTDSLSLNSVNNYRHTLRNITDHRSLLLCTSTPKNRHCVDFYETQNSSKDYAKAFYTEVQLNPPRNTIIVGRNSFTQLHTVWQLPCRFPRNSRLIEILYWIARKSFKGSCHWYLVTNRRTVVVSTQGVLSFTS